MENMDNNCLQISQDGPDKVNPSQLAILQDVASDYLCVICGDHAVGTHYSVRTCNGCRGFFRRSVKNNRNYQCRRQGNCVVTATERSRCKKCRFGRCLRMGMKPQGVSCTTQIHPYKRSESITQGSSIDNSCIILQATEAMSIHSFLEAYHSSREYARQVVHIPYVNEIIMGFRYETFITGIHQMMLFGVLSLVEWVKKVPGFKDLQMQDQVTLLRTAIPKYLVVHWAYGNIKPPKLSDPEVLMVLEDRIVIPRRFIVQVETIECLQRRPALLRIHDELIHPMKEANIDDKILICFLAVILFDPNIKGLMDPMKVKELRKTVQNLIAAEAGVMNFFQGIMDLLLLSPIIDSIAEAAKRNIKSSGQFTDYKVAKLLREMYFSPTED